MDTSQGSIGATVLFTKTFGRSGKTSATKRTETKKYLLKKLLRNYSLLLRFEHFELTENTARKMSKYRVFSGSYFPVFGPENTWSGTY